MNTIARYITKTVTRQYMWIICMLLVFVFTSINLVFAMDGLQRGEVLEKRVHTLSGARVSGLIEDMLLINEKAFIFTSETSFIVQNEFGTRVKTNPKKMVLPCIADIEYATYSSNLRTHPFGENYKELEIVIVKSQ